MTKRQVYYLSIYDFLQFLKNNIAEQQAIYGAIRSYDITNGVYNYFDRPVCNGSIEINLNAGDVIEPIINLIGFAMASLTTIKIYGDISINWIDNY